MIVFLFSFTHADLDSKPARYCFRRKLSHCNGVFSGTFPVCLTFIGVHRNEHGEPKASVRRSFGLKRRFQHAGEASVSGPPAFGLH